MEAGLPAPRPYNWRHSVGDAVREVFGEVTQKAALHHGLKSNKAMRNYSRGARVVAVTKAAHNDPKNLTAADRERMEKRGEDLRRETTPAISALVYQARHGSAPRGEFMPTKQEETALYRDPVVAQLVIERNEVTAKDSLDGVQRARQDELVAELQRRRRQFQVDWNRSAKRNAQQEINRRRFDMDLDEFRHARSELDLLRGGAPHFVKIGLGDDSPVTGSKCKVENMYNVTEEGAVSRVRLQLLRARWATWTGPKAVRDFAGSADMFGYCPICPLESVGFLAWQRTRDGQSLCSSILTTGTVTKGPKVYASQQIKEKHPAELQMMREGCGTIIQSGGSLPVPTPEDMKELRQFTAQAEYADVLNAWVRPPFPRLPSSSSRQYVAPRSQLHPRRIRARLG